MLWHTSDMQLKIFVAASASGERLCSGRLWARGGLARHPGSSSRPTSHTKRHRLPRLAQLWLERGRDGQIRRDRVFIVSEFSSEAFPRHPGSPHYHPPPSPGQFRSVCSNVAMRKVVKGWKQSFSESWARCFSFSRPTHCTESSTCDCDAVPFLFRRFSEIRAASKVTQSQSDVRDNIDLITVCLPLSLHIDQDCHWSRAIETRSI